MSNLTFGLCKEENFCVHPGSNHRPSGRGGGLFGIGERKILCPPGIEPPTYGALSQKVPIKFSIFFSEGGEKIFVSTRDRTTDLAEGRGGYFLGLVREKLCGHQGSNHRPMGHFRKKYQKM